MMKRLYSFFLVCFLTTFTLLAQTGAYKISGTIKDSITGEPEAFATLRLTPAGGTRPVAAAAADEKGKFILSVGKKGTYTLQVVSLGKAPLTRTIQVNAAGSTNIGTLTLQEYSSSLGTATVTAVRPLIKAEPDRIAYSIADDPDSQTNSMLDMLRKVPMVTVDGEDNIQVNGSSGFKVYVNGKPNQMMSANPSLILKNYPASAIKKVEVITDPGAKYDAEGTAGILNIITEAETKTTGYMLTPHINPSNRGVFGSVFGMMQIGKLTISGNYGIGHMKQPESTEKSERETFADDVNHLLTSNGVSRHKGTFQFAGIDASYEFDAHNLLSISGGLNTYHGKAPGTTGYTMFDRSGATVYHYNLQRYSKQKYDGYNASVDYQHNFGKEEQALTLSYRFNTSPSSSKSISLYSDITDVPYELTDLYANPRNKSGEHTAQIDFTTPLGKLHKLSTGLKYINRINKSENYEGARAAGSEDEFIRDDERSLNYRHRNDIMAAYGEYTLKIKNFTTRAGLRYEHSHIEVTYSENKAPSFSNNLGDFVPSLNFGYNLAPTSMIKVGYNMRIGRPDISYLSPYVQRPTAESQTYGNPNLDSEKAHNFELGFNSFSQKFNLSTTLSYQLQTNGLTPYTYLSDNNIMTTTFGNLMHQKALSLNTYINWTITKGSAINLNISGSYADYKAYRYYNAMNAHNSGFGGSLFGGLRQDLPLKIKLNLHGGGSLRRPNLQGSDPGFYFYALNFSRSFLPEDRLTLSIMAGNFIHPKRSFRSSMETDVFRTSSIHTNDFMRFGAGIRYRLGSLKAVVKKATRSIENNDVIQQQNSNGAQSGEMGQ